MESSTTKSESKEIYENRKILCGLGEINGFELWSLLSLDKDPVRREHALFVDIATHNLSHEKSKNLGETYAAMVGVEAKLLEYRTVIGESPAKSSPGKIL